MPLNGRGVWGLMHVCRSLQVRSRKEPLIWRPLARQGTPPKCVAVYSRHSPYSLKIRGDAWRCKVGCLLHPGIKELKTGVIMSRQLWARLEPLSTSAIAELSLLMRCGESTMMGINHSVMTRQCVNSPTASAIPRDSPWRKKKIKSTAWNCKSTKTWTRRVKAVIHCIHDEISTRVFWTSGCRQVIGRTS